MTNPFRPSISSASHFSIIGLRFHASRSWRISAPVCLMAGSSSGQVICHGLTLLEKRHDSMFEIIELELCEDNVNEINLRRGNEIGEPFSVEVVLSGDG